MNMLRLWPGPRRRLAASTSAAARVHLSELPAQTYAIGDVHGCFDLFRALEDAILAEAHRDQADSQVLIVVLGDVIDRGPASAQMLDHLIAPTMPSLRRVVLRGNHEDMMSRFLDAPRANAAWLDHGGRETLLSYGALERNLNGALRTQHQQGKDVVPAEHLSFLRDLPLCLTAGPYVFSHAGYDPAKPLNRQTADDFIWADPARLDGAATSHIAVHGHVAQSEVVQLPTRISVDTGAYATGRLSAVKLGKSGPQRVLVARHDGPGTAPIVEAKGME